MRRELDLTESEKVFIIPLRDKGLTQQDVTNRLGRWKTDVRNYLKKNRGTCS